MGLGFRVSDTIDSNATNMGPLVGLHRAAALEQVFSYVWLARNEAMDPYSRSSLSPNSIVVPCFSHSFIPC